MANIVACPNCKKAGAAPEARDPQTWVRCPLCGSSYQLQAALEIVPPTLELIAEPSVQQSTEATTPAAAPHLPDFPMLNEVSPHLATHFAAIPHSENIAHRVSRKPKNPIVELVKIVLGGLAGLVLGYAILFWGFRVDPFHLAKTLPARLVPQKLEEPAQ